MLQRILNFLNHTLIAGIILMTIAWLVSYLVIPKIQDSNVRKRIIREEKVKAIGKFIKNNERINSQLNNIQTMLEIFYKDFRDDPDIKFEVERFNKEKEKLRVSVNERYLKFDDLAWWWYWSLYKYTDANFLIKRDKLDTLKRHLTEYGQNIDESMRILSPLWDMLCRKKQRPGGETKQILKESRTKLNRLRESRDKIIDEIVKLYSSK